MVNLSENDKYNILYPIWGDNMLFEDDEDEALKLAKEKFPNAFEDDIISAFYEFLVDNPE